jgi:acetyl esterase
MKADHDTLPLPPLAPEMQAVLDRLMAEDGVQPDPTLLLPAEGRAKAEAANRRWNGPAPAMARELIVETPGGRRAFVFGRGWAFCSAATHEGAARRLALATGAPVITFDYRLAPEHPYPAGLEDCLSFWEEREHILFGRRWSVSGDSAGANLALALMIRLKSRDLPHCGLLFYGVFDADFESPSYRQVAEGPGLTRGKMQRYWDFYAPEDRRLSDPCLTPARASDEILAALPPLYLNAAEVDPLRSDSEALAARLHALGRKDPFDTVPGVVHGFMQMSIWLPQAEAAFDRAGEAFRTMT